MKNESKSIKKRESQLVKMVILNLMTKKKVSLNSTTIAKHVAHKFTDKKIIKRPFNRNGLSKRYNSANVMFLIRDGCCVVIHALEY